MKIKLVFIFLTAFLVLHASETTQRFLSLNSTGVENFIAEHPEYDGRGTIVFIFDTGVDIGVPGMTRTSTGEVKVIDVRDFTGQGDIKFYEADIEEEDDIYYFMNEDMDYKVKGANNLSFKGADDEYFIGAINEKLWLNSGSGIDDMNGNLKKNDDFFFVTFKVSDNGEEYWVVYLDTDSDGDLSDESPLRDYHVKQDMFSIRNESGLDQLHMGLNVFPERMVVNFHFDDGGHGSHCAGIAAGSKIGGVEFNGVAPGAQVISCKLGNNNFSGGATVTGSMKQCFIFADSVSRATEKPCVVNMSFGIGSEIEEHSEMEKYINDLVDENPYLYLCLSNGNEGPGISTVGLPSTSRKVFSSGAVLTKEVAQDLYGSPLQSDRILYFSSRGAEVAKPDVVSPGACTSTVPNWGNRDRFWGTSMASPYTAGVMALLTGAIKKEFPDVKIPSLLLFNAVRESAVEMPGYDPADQGGGYINVENAYQLIKKYIKAGEIDKFETYKTTATSPNMPSGRSSNLYLRDGSFLTGNESFTFIIDRDNFINKDKFYRIYRLESEADWLKPIQKTTYIRNDQSANVSVKFDVDKMKEPGLYNGRIKAYRNDKSAFPEFELWATVAMPHHFDASNNYRQKWEGRLAPLMFDRYFLDIPAGAGAMKIKLSSIEGKYIYSNFNLHDPDGREMFVARPISGETDETEYVKTFYNPEPGVYELVVNGFFMAKDTSDYKLSVEFFGVETSGDNKLTADDNTLEIINNFAGRDRCSFSGAIQGYQKKHLVKLEGKDYYELPFVLRSGEAEKSFDISVSKEDFNKVTDFVVMIYDEDGVTVNNSALGYRKGDISIKNRFNADSTKLMLVIRPGFAIEAGDFKINIVEKTMFDNPVNFGISANGQRVARLYPSIPVTLECNVTSPENYVPADAMLYGEIEIQSHEKNDPIAKLQVLLNF